MTAFFGLDFDCQADRSRIGKHRKVTGSSFDFAETCARGNTAETNQGALEVPLLEQLILDLYASDIYVVIQTGSAGLMLLITDRDYRIRAEQLIGTNARWEKHTAAQWLHRKALCLFPQSDYARRRMTES